MGDDVRPVGLRFSVVKLMSYINFFYQLTLILRMPAETSDRRINLGCAAACLGHRNRGHVLDTIGGCNDSFGAQTPPEASLYA